MNKITVLDQGHVMLLNMSGQNRRIIKQIGDGTENNDDFIGYHLFDADDTDPAKAARLCFNNLNADRSREQDLQLYEYLISHKHTSPIEMIETWWNIKLPIFVARQFVRHRTASLNEVSARYSTLPADWYIPSIDNVGLKSSSNKQGRDITPYADLSADERSTVGWFLTDLDKHYSDAYNKYTSYLEKGIPPELARLFIGVGNFTEWVWKIDLHNLMHFLSLRLDAHAQYEARVYAQAMYDLLTQYLPKSMEYFDKYSRKPSKEEYELLLLACNNLFHKVDDINQQEILDNLIKKFTKMSK